MKLTTVKSELAKLSPERFNAIRQRYYAIADNLRPLMTELEMADLNNGGNGDALLDEHLIVCEIVTLFDKLKIGSHI
jgi:hypothetical protein